MPEGIRDKVAIIGMGCSKFGEHWDLEPSDLMSEAFEECLLDSGIERSQIDAAWLSTAFDAVNVGPSAIPLATSLRLGYIPVTHVENMCASGTEAFRGACYAVASGAAEFALALGVEKRSSCNRSFRLNAVHIPSHSLSVTAPAVIYLLSFVSKTKSNPI